MENNQSVCAIKEKVEILRGSDKQNMFSTTEIINAFDELFSVIANQATVIKNKNDALEFYADPENHDWNLNIDRIPIPPKVMEDEGRIALEALGYPLTQKEVFNDSIDTEQNFNKEEDTNQSMRKKIESGEIEAPNFPFYYSDVEGAWVVATEMCHIGGCDTNLIICDDEKAAYEKAMKLTRQGREQKIGRACPSCSSGYFD
ncbi:hypothetical protein MKZ21_30725 [Paenibacillus sp. FSL P2-0536]|uniref:hypothetical protein n=1 Tax=Paenibacillus sp. FSL P2-0536 TaxID=2921629 RepID=UPI0030FBC1E7